MLRARGEADLLVAQSRTWRSHILAEAEAAEWVSASSASPPQLGRPGGGDRRRQAKTHRQTGAPTGTQLVFVASSAVVAESWELRHLLSALSITHTFVGG